MDFFRLIGQSEVLEMTIHAMAACSPFSMSAVLRAKVDPTQHQEFFKGPSVRILDSLNSLFHQWRDIRTFKYEKFLSADLLSMEKWSLSMHNKGTLVDDSSHLGSLVKCVKSVRLQQRFSSEKLMNVQAKFPSTCSED